MTNQGYKDRYIGDLRALLSAAQASGGAFAEYGAAATSADLKQLMDSGADEDTKQLDALRGFLTAAGPSTEGTPNSVVDALIAEGKHRVGSSDDPELRDAAVIDALRANLHYYIAAYGAAGELASRLGHGDDARALSEMRDHMIDKEAEYGRLARRVTDRLVGGSGQG